MTTTFRSAYRQDLLLRVVDLGAHLTVAFLLPGTWWYQFLPDMLLPYLWIRGMVTNQFEPSHSFWVIGHRLLHLRGDLALVPLLVLLALTPFYPLLVVQWLAHVSIDSVTHSEGWQ